MEETDLSEDLCCSEYVRCRDFTGEHMSFGLDDSVVERVDDGEVLFVFEDVFGVIDSLAYELMIEYVVFENLTLRKMLRKKCMMSQVHAMALTSSVVVLMMSLKMISRNSGVRFSTGKFWMTLEMIFWLMFEEVRMSLSAEHQNLEVAMMCGDELLELADVMLCERAVERDFQDVVDCFRDIIVVGGAWSVLEAAVSCAGIVKGMWLLGRGSGQAIR
eukprot:379411-Hanusia_phi.AAC.1